MASTTGTGRDRAAAILWIVLIAVACRGAEVYGQIGPAEPKKIPFPLVAGRLYRHDKLKFEKPFELTFKWSVKPAPPPQSHLVYTEATDQTITIGGVGDLARKLGFDGPGYSMQINTERFPNAFMGRKVVQQGKINRVLLLDSFGGHSLCHFVCGFHPRPKHPSRPPPAPELCRRRAEEFLRKRGLFPAGAVFSDIRYSERSELKDGTETTEKLFGIVRFRQRLDGRTVLKSKIAVDVLNDMRIRAVFFFMREWRPLRKFPVVSPEDAVRRIQGGLGHLRTETIRMEAVGVIDKCTIALATRDGLAKPKSVFLQPVYVIEGWQDLPAKPRFRFIVPALTDDFLQPVGGTRHNPESAR